MCIKTWYLGKKPVLIGLDAGGNLAEFSEDILHLIWINLATPVLVIQFKCPPQYY